MINVDTRGGLGDYGLPIAQITLPIYGLQPEIRKSSGEVVVPSNLDAKIGEIDQETVSRPWFNEFLEDVHQGKKNARFKLVTGALVITAAIAGYYEFGVANGRDVKELFALIHQHRNKSKAQ